MCTHLIFLLPQVATTAILASLVLPGCDAGMDDWFKGMFKGNGKRGRRRPSGGYRPIYIHAPPIIQHAPHPPPPTLYKKPTIPSYSYGSPSTTFSTTTKGFSSFGSDFSGVGGGFATSYGKGFSSIGQDISSGHSFSSGGFGGHGSSGFSSFGSSLKAPAIGQTSYSATSTKLPSFTSLSISPGVTSYGTSALHSGGSLVFPEPHANGIVHDLKGGSSYGSSLQGGKQAVHGFGPIKEDDLIEVGIGHSYNSHGFGVDSGFNDIHIEGLSAPVSYSDDIHAGAQIGPLKGGRHVSLEPPPVYHPKGSKTSGSFDLEDIQVSTFEGKDIGVAAFDGKDAGALSVATDYKTVSPHAAPLPMAEHGTSSQSYLETPPAPLYSLSSDEDVHAKKTFQPSKQIPFPDEGVEELVIASGDVDTSYSAPAVGISSAPKIETHSVQFGSGNQHSGQLVQGRQHSTQFGQGGQHSVQFSQGGQHSAQFTQDGHSVQFSQSGQAPQAVVSYDAPLDYSDPIIEIVFEDAEPGYTAPAPAFDPSLYQPQSDDVEVYFIEVSDDEAYDSVDDLDLTKALQGVKEEFPEGLPSELSETLINSGYLDNAQIEVLDLETALGDNSLDHSVRSALRDAYGSESKNVHTIVEAPTDEAVELRLKRLLEDKKTIKGDAELAKDLGRFRKGRYGGVVELNDKASDSFLPVTVDGNLIPIPEHPQLQGRKISGVLVYADKETDSEGNESKKANVVLSTSRRGRQLSDDAGKELWSSGDWTPIPTEKKTTS